MKQIIKTKDYGKFTLRSDNRSKIDQNHVRNLVHSIKTQNLLDMRPISVNSQFEIMDGQHRFLAAKELGIEFYYMVGEELKSRDIILMNLSKAWNIADYLNYYIKNGFEHYIRLEEFMNRYDLKLRVTLGLLVGASDKCLDKFKLGEFTFEDDSFGGYADICQESIRIIQKHNGTSHYTSSTRFWKALAKIVSHEEFEKEKWYHNLNKVPEKISVKACYSAYVKVLSEIYNYRSRSGIIKFMDTEDE